MAWQLVEVPNPFFGEHARPWRDLPPGSYWRLPVAEAKSYAVRPLSAEFHASGRDFVIYITLPGGVEWCPDMVSTESGQGWTVTGELPNITVRASVHQIGRYHGFVTDGVLTDDLEGRTYAEIESR